MPTSSELQATSPARPGASAARASGRPRRRSTRPFLLRIGWTLRDYAKRVWDNAGEDNIFFLTGGIAFNILLAAVPFVLLLLSGVGYLLHQSTAQSSAALWLFVERLLPPHPDSADAPIHSLINQIVVTRSSAGLFGLIGFVWFSTRLFGSLRTVLGEVFDIEQGRSIIGGKLFDIQITVLATVLFAAYTALSAYLQLATSRGIRLIVALGLRSDVMGRVGYVAGRAVATLFILLMFFALYKFLPNRRIRWKAAMLGAMVTTVLFELARALFTAYVIHFNPGSLYTGTLYAIVIVVFWVYYAALIFIIGGEVAQVYELRRVRRLQHEVFE